jgi:hypothetical protein
LFDALLQVLIPKELKARPRRTINFAGGSPQRESSLRSGDYLIRNKKKREKAPALKAQILTEPIVIDKNSPL